jgi:hypothetical protein
MALDVDGRDSTVPQVRGQMGGCLWTAVYPGFQPGLQASPSAPPGLTYDRCIQAGSTVLYRSAVDQSQYAAGWRTLTLINAGLAQGKGRSGLAWFLVSLLLGPIATIIVVLPSPAPGRSS